MHFVNWGRIVRRSTCLALIAGGAALAQARDVALTNFLLDPAQVTITINNPCVSAGGESIGACCMPDSTCNQAVTPVFCTDTLGGIYQGDATNCIGINCSGCGEFSLQVIRDNGNNVLDLGVDQLLATLQPGVDFVNPTASGDVALTGFSARLSQLAPNNRIRNGDRLFIRAVINDDDLTNNNPPDPTPATVTVAFNNLTLNADGGAPAITYQITAPAAVPPINVAWRVRGAPAVTQVLTNLADLTPGVHGVILAGAGEPGSLRDFLDALGDGNRIANGDPIDATLSTDAPPAFAPVNRSVNAAVSVNILGLAAGASPRLQYRINAPGQVNSFTLDLLRNDVVVTTPPQRIPLVADANSFLPGADRDVALSAPEFQAPLGTLPIGSRVRNGDRLAVEIPAGLGYPSVRSSDRVVNVTVNVTAFSFNAVENDGDSRNVRVSYTIDAPAIIDPFGVTLLRGITPLVPLPGLSDGAGHFTPGPHNDVQLDSTAFAAALNALPDGSRIRNGEALAARADVPPGTLGVLSASANSAVTIEVNGLEFSNNDGSNAAFSYIVRGPARINSFTLDLYRGANAPNGHAVLLSPTPVNFNNGNTTDEGLLTPGQHTLVPINGFQSTLNSLPGGSRIADGQTVFAVPDTLDALNIIGRQVAAVQIQLLPLAVEPSVGNDVRVRMPYVILAPGRTEAFLARIGSDTDPAAAGLDDQPGTQNDSLVIAEQLLDGDAVLPGRHTSEPGAFAALDLAFGKSQMDAVRVEDFVATLDLDKNSVSAVGESAAGINANVDDNFQKFAIAPRVSIVAFNLRTNAGGDREAVVTYRVTESLAKGFGLRFELRRLTDSPSDGDARTTIANFQVDIAAFVDRDRGDHVRVVNLSTALSGVDLRDSDQLLVRLVTTDPAAPVQFGEPSQATADIRVDIRDVQLTVTSLLEAGAGATDATAEKRAQRAIGRVRYNIDGPSSVVPFDVEILWVDGAEVKSLRTLRINDPALLNPGVHEVDVAFGDALAALGAPANALLTLRARVDATGRVSESDETNNEADFAGFQYPVDLRAQTLSFFNLNEKGERVPVFSVGRGVAFNVEVRFEVTQNTLSTRFRTGVLAVTNSAGGVVPLRLANQAIDGVVLTPESNPQSPVPLNVGAHVYTALVTGPSDSEVQSDNFLIQVRLDADNAVTEIDELNNAVSQPSFDTNTAVDSDGDGLTDSEEVRGFSVSRYNESSTTTPLSSAEVQAGFSATLEGQLPNGLFRWKVLVRLNPQRSDTDGDGISDLDEIVTFAIGSNELGEVSGAGPTGVETLPGSTELAPFRAFRVFNSKFVAGIRTDPTRVDSDDDGVPDNQDPAPQIKPSLFSKALAGFDGDVELQSRLLNFDQDGDGFLEAPDANGDGVPDFTRYNELTLEGLFGIDFSNDGTLRDGFDIGGVMAAQVEQQYLADFGVDADQVAPTDDPRTRTLAGRLAGERDTLVPRFGSYRVGSFSSLTGEDARYAQTAQVALVFGELTDAATGTQRTAALFRRPTGAGAERITTRRGNGVIDQNDGAANFDQAVQLGTFPVDNCPGDLSDAVSNETVRFNPAQADIDNDGIGDSCDPDADNDGVSNGVEALGCGAPCGAGMLAMMPLALVGLLSAKWRSGRWSR